MLELAKAFIIAGGATTVVVAVAVLPCPPFVEQTLLVVLFLTPALVPVTLTLKVQELFVANVAPDKRIEPDPPVAEIVPPLQELVNPFGVATTKPAGKVFVKPTPVSSTG